MAKRRHNNRRLPVTSKGRRPVQPYRPCCVTIIQVEAHHRSRRDTNYSTNSGLGRLQRSKDRCCVLSTGRALMFLKKRKLPGNVSSQNDLKRCVSSALNYIFPSERIMCSLPDVKIPCLRTVSSVSHLLLPSQLCDFLPFSLLLKHIRVSLVFALPFPVIPLVLVTTIPFI